MLVRLLLVVLMLVGPVPTSDCTCAAAVPTSGPEATLASAPVIAVRSCGCAHRTGRGGKQESTDRTHVCGASHEPTEQHGPVKHDQECPAVQPRAAIADAVVTPGLDFSIDADLSSFVRFDAILAAEPHLFTAKIKVSAPPVPLFIALLNLRN